MTKSLTLIIGLFLSTISFGQTYAYSFSGHLDAEQSSVIEKKIMEMPDVTSCKARIKSDSDKGELIITIEKKERPSRDVEQFKAKQIKDLLMANGLEPLQFIRIKD